MSALHETVEGQVRDGSGYSCIGYAPHTGKAIVLVDSSETQIEAMKVQYLHIEDVDGLRRSWCIQRVQRGYTQPPDMAYMVSSLADRGPGTLRAALEARGRRIVVFRVAGDIALETPITIANPHVVVLGQSAPAGGVCIRGSFIRIESHDVALRHLRCRPGANGETDGIQINAPAHDILIDHCSLTWAVDENVDIYGTRGQDPIRNVEIRHCLIAEGLCDSFHSTGPHSCGIIVGYAENVSIHHNLIALNETRFPLASGRVDIINNVLYGWGSQCMLIRYREQEPMPTRVNIISNYYQKADWSNLSLGEVLVMDYGTPNAPMGIHLSGNRHCRSIGDEWDLVEIHFRSVGTELEYRQESAYPLLHDVRPDSAEDAYNNVLANAGATLPKRDVVDARIVADVQNGTGGIIDDPSDVGGWPDLTA